MEFPASWSLDSKHNGMEKMESGLNARVIDFAKFGRLYLRNGDWDGKQIVPESWVVELTKYHRVPNGHITSICGGYPTPEMDAIWRLATLANSFTSPQIRIASSFDLARASQKIGKGYIHRCLERL